MSSTELPSNYASLPFKEIKLSHHPASSPTPTPIIVLTLYRPKNANAYTNEMAHEMVEAYRLFELDDRVKAIVVTGHGKMFCAGADLSIGFQRDVESKRARDHRDGGGLVVLAIHRCSKPTIAAINGSAVGVGVTMTLPMAIRIVSRDAKLGVPFARRGIVTDATSSYFLPRLLGYSRAIHLVTTGAVYPATHNLWDGLFSELLPPDQVLPRALEVAEDVVANTSTVSGKIIRDLIWRTPADPEQVHLIDSEMLMHMFRSKDHQEGIKSFLEKRAPKFEDTMSKNAPPTWPWYSLHDVSLPEVEKAKSKL